MCDVCVYILRGAHCTDKAMMTNRLRYAASAAVCVAYNSRPVHNVHFQLLHGHPLSSDRQHLSYDGCLEVRWEIIRTVLCCIVY